jgi:predicted phage tail protein
VTATTAQITWTTDEAADSQVFYRVTGAAAYQQTAVNPAKVTSHTVALAGLSPQSAYEYYVRSVDAAGNAAQSSPNKTFNTPANAYSYLRFETEGGNLVAPVRTQSGPDTFGGAYIDTPAGTPAGTASNPAGTATFGFNAPAAGSWKLWLRMYGPGTASDSWFESVDGAARQAVTATTTGSWIWIAGRTYDLTAGLHALELGGREAQARIDRVLLTDDPTFTPTEQAVGDQAPPGTVTAFGAAAADAAVTLSWTNPAGDYAKTVIRYRTDGQYPVSPVDGFAATTDSGTAGAADSFVHGGLTNGTTYVYGAFALDAAGNVSAAAQASATPQAANLPPAPVANLRRTDIK